MNAHLHLDRKTLILIALASAGFGLLQSARLFDLNSGPYSSHPYALVGLTVEGLVFVVVAMLSYFGRIDKADLLFRIAAGVGVGYVLLAAAGSSHPAVLICMQITAGASWSLAILCWMEVFTSYKPVYSLPMIAFSFVINTVVPPLARMLFPGGQLVMLVGMLALSMAALFYCLRSNEYVAGIMKEDVVPLTSMAEALSRTKRAVAGACVFSLVCGFVLEIDIFSGLQYAQTNLTGFFTIFISVLLLVVLLVLRPRKANVDYISPIVVLCLVSILLQRSFGMGNPHAAGSLMVSFLITFYVLLWLMFISEAHERKLPAFFLLGLALGVARLSVALGRFAAQTLLEHMALDVRAALLGGVWVLVLALSFIFCSYLRYVAKLHTPLPDDTPEQPFHETWDHSAEAAWQHVSHVFHLTKRECEITREFAAGRSARHIASQLVLSEHTIKTHLRHAYAKMDVHSRQELLDLMEGLSGRTRVELFEGERAESREPGNNPARVE